MKFFVDTADVAEIKDLAATGVLDGVTTNPSLIAKSGRKFLDVIAEICAVVPGPVSAEVTAMDVETMLKEAAVLRRIAPNVAIKLPLTWDGLNACKALNLRVPDDISIMGFDNIALARYVSPKLTTMDQNMFRLGSNAAQLLIERIENGPCKRITLDNVLVKRETTGRAPIRIES